MHDHAVFAKLEQKRQTQKFAAQEDEKGGESATSPTLSRYEVSVQLYRNTEHKRK